MAPNRTHLGLQIINRDQSIVIDDFTYTLNSNRLLRWLGRNTYNGHYRTCQDPVNHVERSFSIDWDSIWFVDYKCFNPNRLTDQDLARVLNNPQPIKILHIACNNTDPQYNQLVNMITCLKDITWRNQLCIEYFYHHAPAPYTVEQTIEQIRAVQPRGLLQADLFIDSMDLHIPL